MGVSCTPCCLDGVAITSPPKQWLQLDESLFVEGTEFFWGSNAGPFDVDRTFQFGGIARKQELCFCLHSLMVEFRGIGELPMQSCFFGVLILWIDLGGRTPDNFMGYLMLVFKNSDCPSCFDREFTYDDFTRFWEGYFEPDYSCDFFSFF